MFFIFMDNQITLKLLYQGSSSQRKRKLWLDSEKKKILGLLQKKKNDSQLEQQLQICIDNQHRLCSKYREGIHNTRRTVIIRRFFARLFQKDLVSSFEEVSSALDMLEDWLDSYEQIIQQKNNSAEEKENKKMLKLCFGFEHQKKILLAAAQKKENPKERASLLFLALVLTTIILLFTETKEIRFDALVFDSRNRYNPLNAFFPLKF